MGSRLRKVFDSVGWIFRDGGSLPWRDEDIIIECESDIKRFYEEKDQTEIADACDEQKRKEMLIRLAWALVHSRDPARVHEGLGMLQVSLDDGHNSLPKKEKRYLMAVGYYRSGDYANTRKNLERCMEIDPTWVQPLSLQKLLENARKRDGLIGIGIVSGLGGAIGAVGFLAGGMVTAGLVAIGAVIAAAASTIKNKSKFQLRPHSLIGG